MSEARTSPMFVAVTGLPRAGSTLVCQLLAQHPEIQCEGVTSPLCNAVLGIRRMVSKDRFFLSQLDQSFERGYAHLGGAMQGFVRGWYRGCDKKLAVDKNRAWLHAIELLLQIEPDAKLIVCLRELGQIYGSIEAQHQRTILMDFIDELADFDRFGRAEALFAKDRTIGAPLISLQAVADLPRAVQNHLYMLRFEDLVEHPVRLMSELYAWLGVSPMTIDPEKVAPTMAAESDSHYSMKYLHTQLKRVGKPQPHSIPSRIQAQIEREYSWFYQYFYSKHTSSLITPPPV
ncbi:MAG: sulfotransferase [Gammaproteobacteria bacterium]